MTDLPYAGPERRRAQQIVDDAKLDLAMEEVRKLYGRTTELAEAVARTVPKQEVEARERQFKILLIAVVAATVLCLVLYPVLVRVAIGSRFDRLDDGQRVGHCLQTKAEAERTGTFADSATLVCEQKVTR